VISDILLEQGFIKDYADRGFSNNNVLGFKKVEIPITSARKGYSPSVSVIKIYILLNPVSYRPNFTKAILLSYKGNIPTYFCKILRIFMKN